MQDNCRPTLHADCEGCTTYALCLPSNAGQITDLDLVLWVVLYASQIICSMRKPAPAAIAAFALSLAGPAHSVCSNVQSHM